MTREAEQPMTAEKKEKALEHLIATGRSLLATFLSGRNPTENLLDRFDGALTAFDQMLICGHRLMDKCDCAEEQKP